MVVRCIKSFHSIIMLHLQTLLTDALFCVNKTSYFRSLYNISAYCWYLQVQLDTAQIEQLRIQKCNRAATCERV